MSVCRIIFARTGAPASTGLAPSTVAVPKAGQEHCARLVRLLPPILTKNCEDVKLFHEFMGICSHCRY